MQCLGTGIVNGNFLVLVIGWPVFLHCTLGGKRFNNNGISFNDDGCDGMFLACIEIIMGGVPN